jgi:hypothetical protein
VIRKWRMAHLVGCHQWVFSNIEEKEHKVNTQVKWRWISERRWRSCDDVCDTLMQANFLDIAMGCSPQQYNCILWNIFCTK